MKAIKRLLFVLITPIYFVSWIIVFILWIPFYIVFGRNLFKIYDENMMLLRDWLVPGGSFYIDDENED